MISAVLIRGGATRHGMAVAGRGSGAACTEFMEDFILLRRKTTPSFWVHSWDETGAAGRAQERSAAVILSGLTSSISRTFLRLVAPETRRTRRFAIPKHSATNSIRAWLAAFSTGGAAMRILIEWPCTPASSVFAARGCM